MGEWYKAVLDVIGKSENWAAYRTVVILSPAERTEEIEQMFLAAARHHADKTAFQYCEWLLRAIDDVELLPLLTEERGEQVLPYGRVAEEAKRRARATRASRAMKLYVKLPSAKGEKDKVPTLIETKRALLNEITTWWQETKDEDEADRIFEFLRGLPVWREEETKLGRFDLIRKATSTAFPVARLERHLLRLVVGCRTSHLEEKGDEIAQILAIGRARNTNVGKTAWDIRVTQPLKECSEAAWPLLESYAAVVAAFDAEVRELLDIMYKKDPFGGGRSLWLNLGGQGYSGALQITYPALGELLVDITLKLAWNSHPDEAWVDDRFDEVKEQIRKWREKHPKISMRLRFAVFREYDKKPAFMRERDFK